MSILPEGKINDPKLHLGSSKEEIDLSLFKWCDTSVLDELDEKVEGIEVLGYEEFLKIPVTELYEKNKNVREERLKKDIEDAKKQAEPIQDIKSTDVFDTINFTDVLEVD